MAGVAIANPFGPRQGVLEEGDGLVVESTGNGGGHDFVGYVWSGGVVVVQPDASGDCQVNVARQHHGVAHLVSHQAAQEPVASGNVSVPLIEVVERGAPRRERHRGHDRLLGHDVPPDVGRRKFLVQPLFLGGAEHRL